MNDRFWKLIAIFAVGGVFYLGHGLHQQSPNQSFPSLTSTALADGIVISNGQIIFTSSPNGEQVYAFRVTPNGVVFSGSARADEQAGSQLPPSVQPK